MSQENLEATLENLRKKHDEAWAKLKQYIYEVYEPRFYKHKVGRKQELINPWKDLEERTKAERQIALLYTVFVKLQMWYWEATGDHLSLPRMYIQKETPDGPRWVKESPEEAASYESSIHTPQSQRPS